MAVSCEVMVSNTFGFQAVNDVARHQKHRRLHQGSFDISQIGRRFVQDKQTLPMEIIIR